MKISEIMTRKVVVVNRKTSLIECARRMSEFDIGVLPVIGEEGLVCGIVTDRDLVVRAMAETLDLYATRVEEIMSSPVAQCSEEDEVETGIRLMELKQVRRLVVTDQKRRAVGIVSLSDFAIRGDRWNLSEEALSKIAEPYSSKLMA
jgi:CBS domain-containing protein